MKYWTLILFLIIIQSCDFDLGIWSEDATIPPVSLDIIEGEYEGIIEYWESEESYVEDLSSDSKFFIRRDDIFFVISFDTTLIYQIPDLNFTLEHNPPANIRNIEFKPGQIYQSWRDPMGFFGSADIDNYTSVFFSMGIQSTDPDSIYFLQFHGSRNVR